MISFDEIDATCLKIYNMIYEKGIPPGHELVNRERSKHPELFAIRKIRAPFKDDGDKVLEALKNVYPETLSNKEIAEITGLKLRKINTAIRYLDKVKGSVKAKKLLKYTVYSYQQEWTPREKHV